MDQEKIGKFISEMRRKKKMTQREFAEKLGVTDKTVSRWENGHYLPDVSLFNDVCEILDIEVAELLRGEKMNKMEKKDVEETIDKIVDISNKEIKKKNKKVIVVSVVLVLLIIILSGLILYFNKEKEEVRLKTGEVMDWPFWIAVKEKEDGWVCSFEIWDYSASRYENPYSYSYNCDNFKYKKLNGYVAHGEEMGLDGEKYTYDIEVNHPEYIFNDMYNKDLNNISNYFSKYQFNKKIEMKDLEDLELEYISKKEILELYNLAITSEKINKLGNYPNTHLYNYLNVSMTMDNYTWYVGFLMHYGHINYISLELMIDGEYLSDLVFEDKATDEQREMYDNILKIEKYILGKQVFSLPDELSGDRPYIFLEENFNEIKQYETEIENE